MWEATKSARKAIPAQAVEEWPEGKERRPSVIEEGSLCMSVRPSGREAEKEKSVMARVKQVRTQCTAVRRSQTCNAQGNQGAAGLRARVSGGVMQ